RAFNDKKTVRAVAEAFLNKNLLAAPSYAGITSPTEPPPFNGIDDRAHYHANVAAYLASRNSEEAARAALGKIKAEVAAAKKETFSGPLARFDDLRAAHVKGDLGLGTYVKKLADYSTEQDLLIARFLETFEMESTLNFPQV